MLLSNIVRYRTKFVKAWSQCEFVNSVDYRCEICNKCNAV